MGGLYSEMFPLSALAWHDGCRAVLYPSPSRERRDTAVSVLMMCLCVGLGPCVLGCVQLSVLTDCRLVHQLHVCLWQWSTQSLVHVPKWSEAELALPHRWVELTVSHH